VATVESKLFLTDFLAAEINFLILVENNNNFLISAEKPAQK
jgi:hypothetical protein